MSSSTALLAILFVFLWNSGFIGAEYGLPYAGTLTQLFWRYFALTLILFLYLILRSRFRWPGWSIVTPTFLVGILAHATWLGCCLLSIEYGVPAGIVALIVALQPLATGALSGAVVGEHTPARCWAGLLIGFSGVALTVSARIDFNDFNSLFFYFLPLGSVVAMTTATLIQRKIEISRRRYILPLDLTLFYQCLASAVVLVMPAMLIEGMTAQWQPEFLGIMLWLIVAVSLFAYALMFKLIKRIEVTRMASLFYLGPPVTMLMAWIVFGDTLKLMDLAGLFIAFIGVILVQSPFNSQATERADDHSTKN
jgi:drug/metabolite transporter (DMT)-like permease